MSVAADLCPCAPTQLQAQLLTLLLSLCHRETLVLMDSLVLRAPT